jgi:hypothetical protein
LAKSTHQNEEFSKKPGFWPIARILKETGFLAKSTHQNEEFSKKPGFWPIARKS